VRGELRVEVRDSQGTAVAASAELVSEANQVRRTIQIAPDGRATVQDLPFGIYRLSLTAENFAPWNKLIEIVPKCRARFGNSRRSAGDDRG